LWNRWRNAWSKGDVIKRQRWRLFGKEKFASSMFEVGCD
jgi:hypothetical protein